MKHVLLDNAKKELMIKLKKAAKTEKKNYLAAVADAMDVSVKNFTSVNVYKLNKLVEKNKDKIFIVPGVVLAFGKIEKKVNVYAYRFSKEAIVKIHDAKGSAKTLDELIKDKVDGKNVIFVK